MCPKINYTANQLIDLERSAFIKIPGMQELCDTASTHEQYISLLFQYPDAAFAIMIADNLHIGDGELRAIHQQAYSAILSGDTLSNVKHKYKIATDAYHQKHLWD